MASASRQPATSNVTQMLETDELKGRVLELKKASGSFAGALTDDVQYEEGEFDYASLIDIIFTSVNGIRDVEEQRVQVTYLATEQYLMIPAGLAINPNDQLLSEARHDEQMVINYRKAAVMPYLDIVALLNAEGTIADKRNAFNQRAAAPAGPLVPLWSTENYYLRADGTTEDQNKRNVIFAIFSRILRMNFDVRDFGFLVIPDNNSRLPDNIAINQTPFARDRFAPRLQPYSLESIAALNYVACGSWPLGSWARVYGVACGILPNAETQLNREWRFTHSLAPTTHFEAIRTVHARYGSCLSTLCLNLLAMFGLFHLSKNHTFKSADANMERICTSYLQTLRTMASDAIIEDLKAHMEVACRTAAHPFGLGQTYWLAHALAAIHALASPLAIRLGVTPPLVQRLYIVGAATREWQTLPVGGVLNVLFAEPLTRINAEIAKISASPLYYSELHTLYGCAEMRRIDPGAKTAADALMPIVAGFAQALHIDEQQRKDGLALALSFLNVERDAKVATRTYAHLWSQYIDGIDQSGLEKFVRTAFSFAEPGGVAQ